MQRENASKSHGGNLLIKQESNDSPDDDDTINGLAMLGGNGNSDESVN